MSEVIVDYAPFTASSTWGDVDTSSDDSHTSSHHRRLLSHIIIIIPLISLPQSCHIKDLSLLGIELPTWGSKAKDSTSGPLGHFDSESLEVSMILPFSLVLGVAVNVTLSGLVKSDLVVL